jgi:hypothetical protein
MYLAGDKRQPGKLAKRLVACGRRPKYRYHGACTKPAEGRPNRQRPQNHWIGEGVSIGSKQAEIGSLFDQSKIGGCVLSKRQLA